MFYSEWQFACCGDPFAVGDRVDWRGMLVDADDEFARRLGFEAYEEHHGGDRIDVAGTIDRIQAVFRRFRHAGDHYEWDRGELELLDVPSVGMTTAAAVASQPPSTSVASDIEASGDTIEYGGFYPRLDLEPSLGGWLVTLTGRVG